MVLSPFIEVGKIFHKPGQVVDRDLFTVREASGENDSVSVTDSAGVTWNKDLKLVVDNDDSKVTWCRSSMRSQGWCCCW